MTERLHSRQESVSPRTMSPTPSSGLKLPAMPETMRASGAKESIRNCTHPAMFVIPIPDVAATSLTPAKLRFT